MRRLMALTLLLAGCSLTQAQATDAPLVVGAKAPGFTLTDLAGKSFKLSDGYGKQVTVLDFGRFTCAPCRTVMGELEKLQQRYGGDRVGLYSVNLDGVNAKETAPEAVKQLGLTFPILLDTRFQVATKYQVTSIPYLVVVDAEGIVRLTHMGYQADLPAKLIALIEKYRPAPKLPRLLEIEGLGCTSCKTMPPLLNELQKDLAGKVSIEILDFNPDLVDQYRLEATPTQIFFDSSGQEVYRHGGPMTGADILAQFAKMGVAVK
ncbi:MAG: redoxin domain-containing protein [Armatimonadota bacterium]